MGWIMALSSRHETSHIEISDKQRCNRKGTRAVDNRGAGRERIDEIRFKTARTSSDEASIFSMLTSLRSKKDKIS